MPATGQALNFVSLVFHVLPKNLISYLTGTIARLELPSPLSGWMVGAFARTFGLNMAEAEHPLSHYKSVEDLFTRKLRDGLRPIAAPLASPADGYLARSAPTQDGMAIQAKGIDYSVEELVYGEGVKAPRPMDPAWFQTIYLAPHNYHRVHSPFSGTVTAVRYVPGQLWPVNLPFVLRIPRLFARNERLVFDFDLEGGGRAWAVMVGAFNVGRMTTPLDPELVTNAAGRQLGAEIVEKSVDLKVHRGDELGTFMLGSTVVLVFDQKAIATLAPHRVFQAEGNEPILMGQPLTKGDEND